MCKSRKKYAEVMNTLSRRMLDKIFSVAFADGEGVEPPAGDGGANGSTDPTSTPANGGGEGATNPPVSSATNQINYEDLIKRARKEEKDKLYGQISALKKEKENLIKDNNDKLIRIGQLEADLDALKSGGDTQEVATLRQEIETLKTKLAENEEAIKEKVRAELEAEYKVKLYRTEKLASDEVKNGILPMFLETITGNTNEEIDSAIAKAVELTKQAKEQLGVATPASNTDNGAGAGNASANGVLGFEPTGQNGNGAPNGATYQVPPTVVPPNPASGGGNPQYTAEYIRGLDPASKEFQQIREQLGLK